MEWVNQYVIDPSVEEFEDMIKLLPVKSWCKDVEDSAYKQILNLAQLPFAFHHVAIMPDCHAGYGMPIGGVLATKNVVIPNAVGVDIGCGMNATKTGLTSITTDELKRIMGKIREQIPVGFEHRKEKNEDKMPFKVSHDHELVIVAREYTSACKQIGTLGGGNHFIEIQKGSDGYIWFMIHSGSRNLGKQVCDHYNKVAKDLNAKWHANVPKAHDLAFLPLDTEEGQLYLKEMDYCLQFAKANRELMAEDIFYIFATEFGNRCVPREKFDIHHNYAAMESHFGENVLVHRKGATRAREGELGIIPGSQGTASYIVRGKGNPDSFMSCSHGSGRKMGRNEAKKTLNLADEQKKLDDQGILHAIRGEKDLDEAAGAYKSIEEVMKQQSDLVDIVTELKPLGVIKG